MRKLGPVQGEVLRIMDQKDSESLEDVVYHFLSGKNTDTLINQVQVVKTAKYNGLEKEK